MFLILRHFIYFPKDIKCSGESLHRSFVNYFLFLILFDLIWSDQHDVHCRLCCRLYQSLTMRTWCLWSRLNKLGSSPSTLRSNMWVERERERLDWLGYISVWQWVEVLGRPGRFRPSTRTFFQTSHAGLPPGSAGGRPHGGEDAGGRRHQERGGDSRGGGWREKQQQRWWRCQW